MFHVYFESGVTVKIIGNEFTECPDTLRFKKGKYYLPKDETLAPDNDDGVAVKAGDAVLRTAQHVTVLHAFDATIEWEKVPTNPKKTFRVIALESTVTLTGVTCNDFYYNGIIGETIMDKTLVTGCVSALCAEETRLKMRTLKPVPKAMISTSTAASCYISAVEFASVNSCTRSDCELPSVEKVVCTLSSESSIKLPRGAKLIGYLGEDCRLFYYIDKK